MEFKVVPLSGSLNVVFATGEIKSGDSQKLALALDQIGRDTSGTKVLALDSPGGLVSEALAMVAIMDKVGVTTVVPPKEICASACGQIVFVSGKLHVVMDGGFLGIHTCSTLGSPDPLCNEAIATNALMHGVPYGSVLAFMKYTKPTDMAWFSSRDADCYGLSLWPPEAKRGVQKGEIAPCIRDVILRAEAGAALPSQPPMSECGALWAEIRNKREIGIFEGFRRQCGASYPAYDALAQERIQVLRQKPPAEGGGAASATGFFVSLKSAPDAQTIRREIPVLAEKYGSILGGVQIILKIADLGSKGVIYRAVAGPLGTRQKAMDLCEKIRRVGGFGSCFVTN